jgi:hypothetical protein
VRVLETEEDLIAVADDVVQCETDQAGDWLGVAEQQDRGDPGAERLGLVGEDLAEEGEPLLGGERSGALGLLGGNSRGLRQLVGLGPPQEGFQATSPWRTSR